MSAEVLLAASSEEAMTSVYPGGLGGVVGWVAVLNGKSESLKLKSE